MSIRGQKKLQTSDRDLDTFRFYNEIFWTQNIESM